MTAEEGTPGRPTSGASPSGDASADVSLGVARFLSWTALLFILLSTLVISLLIANAARRTILGKQEEVARQFAENLNHQIYQRYTVPRYLGVRGVRLFNLPQADPFAPSQFLGVERPETLDQIVQFSMHGQKIVSLGIYDHAGSAVYALNADTEREMPPLAAQARAQNRPAFALASREPFWKALIALHLPPRSFVLRAAFPMSTENQLISYEDEGSDLDILEFSEDITDEFRAIVGFQRIIIGTIMTASAILFVFLILLIRKAERMLAFRVAQQQRLERELNQHEKLAGMGRVISGIAHEIRNPLGIIRSSAELLLRRAPKDDSSHALLKAIHEEARRLSQTVTDFLDYARPRNPCCAPVPVRPLLEQAVAFLQTALEDGGTAFVLNCPDTLAVMGDKALLYRAFYNIIMNAVQAMNGSGEVVVDAACANGRVTLSFTDSGPGFDPAVRERILDPFFTTKDGGTGLGLPIVQSIITSMNGELCLDNAPSGGARVRVTLDAAPDGLETKPA